MHGVFRLHGAYANLGPLLFIAAMTLFQRNVPASPGWIPLAALLVGALTSLGGALFPFRALAGRIFTTTGLFLFLVLCARVLGRLPQQALLALILISSALYLLWTAELPKAALPRVPAAISAARSAGSMAVLSWFVIVPLRLADGFYVMLALAAAIAIACFFTTRWLALEMRGRRRKTALFAVAALTSLGLMAAFRDSLTAAMTSAMLVPFLTVVGARETTADVTLTAGAWDLILVHPERMLILTFLSLSAVGALLLSLPQSAVEGTKISGIDAAFTAMSAVCVTGLVVVDTGSAFSSFGQFVIMVLIQTGGLGIMTFSTAALALLGRRLSVRHEAMVATLSGEHRSEVLHGIRRILLMTFGAEAIGALLLWISFAASGEPAGMALWRAVFTAVSAFCNAGFALQADSLIPYQNNAVILHTVGTLVILGGLSPASVVALPRMFRGRHVALQHKLVWLVTASLLLGAFVAILTFEWRHSLDGMPILERINNAWFMALTPRTAGFNSLDLLAMHPASITLTMALMFIGGSPGGTAGGVKTTTLAVLILAVVAAFRGERRVTVFNRLIPHEIVYKTAAVVTAGVAMGGFILLIVQLTQNLPVVTAGFEVVSALGTVGLSLGGTPELDGVGKALIMLAMFTGRVGPLSVFLFLATSRKTAPWSLPEEQIGVS